MTKRTRVKNCWRGIKRSRTLAQAMTADGLSVAPATAQQRLDRLKADPRWLRRLMTGDAEVTAEYEQLNKDLAG